MRLFLSSTALFLAFWPVLASAQVTVSVGTLPSVAIASFGGTGGPEAAAVLTADLKRTSEINPTTGTGAYSVTGQFSGTGLTATLTRRGDAAPLVSQTFTGDYRSAAHQLADAIVQAVKGHPGFATGKLAFIATSAGAKELFLADVDGFKARPITSDHTISSCPALSPDGQNLAYTSYKSGYADLYVISMVGGARNRVSFFPGINSGPCFSPDGTRIALTLSKDGNPEIYTISAGGGDPIRITHTRGAETSPSWSPTGDRLVFSSDDHGTPQLFTSPAAGGGMSSLHTLESYCTKPDWSPDGKLIAFTTRLSGEFQIALFNLTTNSTSVLTTSGGENPVWTRDSRHLFFDNHGSIYVLDTESRTTFPIETHATGATEPTLSR